MSWHCTIENEAVHSILDFFERRTGRVYFNINTISKLVQPVFDLMSETFRWSQERKHREMKWLDKGLTTASEFL